MIIAVSALQNVQYPVHASSFIGAKSSGNYVATSCPAVVETLNASFAFYAKMI
jgi:hypothetical protein